MQAPVDICYAGVVVGRAEEVHESDGGDYFFLVTKDPLPVGTLVGVRAQDVQFNVRVARVVETADGSGNGMQVRRLGEDDPGAAQWIPPPPPIQPVVVLATPAPVVAAPAVVAEQAPVVAEPAVVPEQQPVVAEPPAVAEQVPAAAEPAPAAAPSTAPVVSEPEPVTHRRHARKTAVHKPAPVEPVPSDAGARVAEAAPIEKTVPYAGVAPVAREQDVPESVEVFLHASSAGDQAVTASKAAARPTPPDDSNGTPETAPASEQTASDAVESSAEPSGPSQTLLPLEGDLPPARPVQGASARRRTKRRR